MTEVEYKFDGVDEEVVENDNSEDLEDEPKEDEDEEEDLDESSDEEETAQITKTPAFTGVLVI